MAKTKTYPAGYLAKIARTSIKLVVPLVAKLGHKPLDTVVINGRKFRSYDQAAVDAVTAWRAEKDAAAQVPVEPPKTEETAPSTPIVSDPGAVFALLRKIDDLAAALRQVQVTQTEAAVGLKYLNDKLDRIEAQVSRLNTELGVGATILDGLAQGAADDAVRN